MKRTKSVAAPARTLVLLQLLYVAGLLGSSTARADSGVSDSRVSLPAGPGSIGGAAQNASVNPNMGSMSFSVPLELPQGFAQATPSLQIGYSSMAGNSSLGMGWDLPLPYIERMTVRGLPEYDAQDAFVYMGTQELVATSSAEPREYRARFEGGFVRYRWHARGTTGSDGYWTAEMPDGTVAYFGANRAGETVTNARSKGPEGTFRYYLHEEVDSYGHVIRYSYAPSASDTESVPLLRKIEYAFVENTPRFAISFAYESRVDAHTDCKPGYCERLSERMAAIEVSSSGELINRYLLAYEAYASAGGLSRLSHVERYGADGALYPVRHTFAYSRALGSLCEDSDCAGPKLVSMGNIGGGVQSGHATLIDMNGDALPDLVDTSDVVSGGKHSLFISELSADGSQTFSPAITASVDGGMNLSDSVVEVLDVDGDGFVDMVNARTGDVLRNLGKGDWSELYSLYAEGDGDTPDFDEGFQGEDEELEHIRFLDYDNDKRIDIVRSVPTDTQIYRNGPTGFALDDRAMVLGVGFSAGRLQLSDMNGDGLVDPVQIAAGAINYFHNLGWGQWSTSTEIVGPAFGLEDIPFLEIEDLNGDELSDLVIVTGSQLRYSLNRDGVNFDDWVSVQSVGGQALPTRTAQSAVLFADMNGSGSSDVVWIDQAGAVTYLELFPVLPNLLSRIENGLGMITEVTYDTSVAQLAASAEPWKFQLPHPMSVVSRIDTWDELSTVHEDTSYVYRDAFYDGGEKQFRGFAHVETLMKGDENQEEGVHITDYEVGATDPYRYGILVKERALSAGRVLSSTELSYKSCPLSGVPAESALTRPIRYICQTKRSVVNSEGAPSDQHVTLEQTFEYDGYGNATKVSNLGVTSIGGRGCEACERDADAFGAPCGTTCLGDELYTELAYTAPTDAVGGWQLRNVYNERSYGRTGSPFYSEKKTYYDGPDFQGLPLGEVGRGDPMRIEERVSQDDLTVQSSRFRVDAHGNVLESIDANGAPGADDHRTTWTYSDDGLVVKQTAIYLKDGAGKPYVLVRGYDHEPGWDNIISNTNWVSASSESAADLDAAPATKFSYDEFGRLAAMARPGDTLAAPSLDIRYELGSPVSRIAVHRRSQAGGAQDLETVQCMDGRGRTFQERNRIRSGQYEVTGFQVFNVRGTTVREYQAYESTSADCDRAPPQDGRHSIVSRDAMFRVTRTVLPDSKLYESASTEEVEYLPLGRVIHDPEDTDPNSPHYATPRTERTDGLGRLIAIERLLEAGGRSLTHTISYDGLGNLRGYVDPAGNERVQEYDVLGRIFQVRDPDTGLTRFYHDAAGNRIRVIDPNGVSTRFQFDGVNRLLAQWEDKREKETRVDYTYDSYAACKACTGAAGSLAALRYLAADGEVEERFGYDERERATYYAKKLRDTWYEVESKFDNADRVTETKYPGGITFTYKVDGLDRVTEVPGYIEEMTYSAKGDPERMVYQNGATTQYTHDDRMRLTGVVTSTPKHKGLLNLSYKYDRASNVRSIQDESASVSQIGASVEYDYDAVYRLISASLASGAGEAEALSFSYDDIDNLTEKSSSLGAKSPAHVGTYTYSSKRPHQAVKAGDRSYAYDDSGQMTDHHGQKLDWDSMGRLTSATREDKSKTSYTYGATSERLERVYGGHRTSFVAPDFEIRDGHTIVNLTLSDRRLAKIEQPNTATAVLTDLAPATGSAGKLEAGKDGAITAADAWLANAQAEGTIELSGVKTPSAANLLLAAATRRMLVGSEQRVTYYHHDSQGSTVAATDEDGEVVFEARYYPFGEQLASSGGAPEDHRYTGKEMDPETGLAYYGARYADPYLGRWTAADPTFALVGSSMFDRPEEATGGYLFSGNNPGTMVDEDGRLIANAVGAAVGFVVGAGMAAIKAHVMREDRNASFRQTLKSSWKGILVGGLVGAGTGFLTGGLSAVGAVAGGAAELIYFNHQYKKLARTANASTGGVIAANDLVRLKRKAAFINIGVSLVAGAGTGSVASGAFAFHPGDAIFHTATQASYVNPETIAKSAASSVAQAMFGGAKGEYDIRKNNVKKVAKGGAGRMHAVGKMQRLRFAVLKR